MRLKACIHANFPSRHVPSRSLLLNAAWLFWLIAGCLPAAMVFAQAPAAFRTQDGFEMQLLAAEPLVADPVAMAYDENGIAYVAEMGDYPHTDKDADIPFTDRTADLPLGRIRRLADRDNDGRFDHSTLFADEVSWPTGVAVYNGGVYVTATPDLLYLKDTDGDGKADVRRTVFTGFRKFNVQAVINNPAWGIDHRIYVAGGSNGGTIRQLSHPEAKPVELGRHDFCFDPREERLELISGGQRFGNTFDDWGNRFLCNIRNPLQHVLLPEHYLARNPLLAAPAAVYDAAPAGDTLPIYRISPVEPWREKRARRWAVESGQSYPRSETAAGGYFTSSSGVTIYRGDAYPAEFRGQAFLGEVAANVIHRLALSAEGVTFTAQRADDKAEFVASTDTWFRPVNFVNAPDGTLHVLDMRRETIEHPWSIPDDIKSELDLRSGHDQGRIWRLAPPGFERLSTPRLGELASKELAPLLGHPNAWRRETARRLLFERQDKSVVPLLKAHLRTAEAELTRLDSLWMLHGLNSLADDDLLVAIADESAGVREHAVRLAEQRLDDSTPVRERVLQGAEDAAFRVRFQTAFSLGETNDPKSLESLAKLARRDGDNLWLRTAILSSVSGRAIDVLRIVWRNESASPGKTPSAFLRELASLVAAGRKNDEITAALQTIAPTSTPEPAPIQSARNEILIGLGNGLKRSGKSFMDVAASDHSPVRQLALGLMAQAQATAKDEAALLEHRVQAIDLLALGRFEESHATLASLLAPSQPASVQLAAARALGSFPQPEVARTLLDAYRGLTPNVRSEAVQALLARASHLLELLDAVELGLIPGADIPAVRRGALMRHADMALREKALALFARDAPAPRAEALKTYQAALRMPFDAPRGRKVFERECQACHRLDGQGHDVGPNLETIRNRTPDEMLVAVLDPNREVSPNFLEYAAVLADGRVATGVIVSDSGASVTLRRPQGIEETILRRDIEELAGSGKSLMPEGLEQRVSPQDMADLLGYLLRREASP